MVMYLVILCSLLLGVVFNKNLVYNLLSLVGVFFMCSLLFILLGLELMGLLIIFIYVGAISILFLFIIMFIEVRYLESKPRVKVLSIQQTITILFM